MSNDKAIAAVTRTLQRQLQDKLSHISGAKVTTKPPDRARPDGAAFPQLNVFLYRTSISAAWRNQTPPGIPAGEDRQPALPLVLSYLLTAYGEDDEEFKSHEILGLAMSVLNDQPLLARSDIAVALAGSELENQVERVRITPHPIPMDEISRLWATFQTGYRISVSYDVSVVLIDSSLPRRSPTPVLARNEGDAGPFATTSFPPEVRRVIPPNGMPIALPGGVVRLQGRHLDGVSTVEVTGAHLKAPRDLPVTQAGPGEVAITIPTTGNLISAGTVLLTPIAADNETRGNTVALRLGPTLVIKNPPLEFTLARGSATVTVGCKPPVAKGQSVQLIVGDRIVPTESPSSATSELTFKLTGFTAGRYLLRLRIDDQDSIPIDGDDPLAFDDNQHLVLR
jgi:Pvc16 N-terminal domain